MDELSYFTKALIGITLIMSFLAPAIWMIVSNEVEDRRFRRKWDRRERMYDEWLQDILKRRK